MFYPETGNSKLVPANGKKGSKIAIVGDFSSGYDLNAMRPLSGPAGLVLEQCLHNAGIIRGECYITNLIKEKSIYRNKFVDEDKGKFTDVGYQYVEILKDELEEINPNIIIALGPASFAALCSLPHLSMYRGYIFESNLIKGKKVLPTFHPAQAIRGMYTYRYLIATDMKKAREESQFPEFRYPERSLVYSHQSCSDVLDWLRFYESEDLVGFDLEVLNYEVSCISFASTPELACVIPIVDRWTIDEEMLIWRGIQKVLGNEKSLKVVQNGMFDIPFLLTHNGVVTRGEIHDTMVGHSIMYPELQKSLGFLGSIYCGSQPYWKDTVKFKSIKGED